MLSKKECFHVRSFGGRLKSIPWQGKNLSKIVVLGVLRIRRIMFGSRHLSNRPFGLVFKTIGFLFWRSLT